MSNSGRNVGEENEVFFKAFLLQQMGLGNVIPPFGKIASLDFGPGVSIPKWLRRYDKLLLARDYVGLKSIFPKAPGGYKADIGINGINYSLKYGGGAKSAIVNHTNRRGFLRICNCLGLDIDPLDNMINEYWIKRESGLITEDISNSHPESPFKDHKNYLDSILKYFLFEGTGSKDSEFKADEVIVFSDPLDPSTYNIFSKEDIVNRVWDSLVFSLRSKKGMPSNYDLEVDADLAPWVRYRPGDRNPKGALHIRT